MIHSQDSNDIVSLDVGQLQALGVRDPGLRDSAIADALLKLGWSVGRFPDLAVKILSLLLNDATDDLLRIALGLTALSAAFAALGDDQEALRVAKRAADLRHRLAARDDLRDLAESLHRLEQEAVPGGAWRAILASMRVRFEDLVAATPNPWIRVDVKQAQLLAEYKPEHAQAIVAKALIDIGTAVSHPKMSAEIVQLGIDIGVSIERIRPDLMQRAIVRGLIRLSSVLPNLTDGADRALETAIEAVNRANRLNDDTDRMALLGSAYVHLGVRYGEAKRWNEAMDAVRIGLECFEQTPSASPTERAFAYSIAGWILASLHKPAEAIDHLNASRRIFEDLLPTQPHILEQLARTLFNISLLSAQLGRYLAALEASDEAVSKMRLLAEMQPNAESLLPGALMQRMNAAYRLFRMHDVVRDADAILPLAQQLAQDGTFASAATYAQIAAQRALAIYHLALQAERDMSDALAACEQAMSALDIAQSRATDETTWQKDLAEYDAEVRKSHRDARRRLGLTNGGGMHR